MTTAYTGSGTVFIRHNYFKTLGPLPVLETYGHLSLQNATNGSTSTPRTKIDQIILTDDKTSLYIIHFMAGRDQSSPEAYRHSLL